MAHIIFTFSRIDFIILFFVVVVVVSYLNVLVDVSITTYSESIGVSFTIQKRIHSFFRQRESMCVYGREKNCLLFGEKNVV